MASPPPTQAMPQLEMDSTSPNPSLNAQEYSKLATLFAERTLRWGDGLFVLACFFLAASANIYLFVNVPSLSSTIVAVIVDIGFLFSWCLGVFYGKTYEIAVRDAKNMVAAMSETTMSQRTFSEKDVDLEKQVESSQH